VLADSVDESLADEWAKGHGSGAVVTKVLDKINEMPQLRRALNESPLIPRNALARLERDEAARGRNVLREDLQNLRAALSARIPSLNRTGAPSHRTGAPQECLFEACLFPCPCSVARACKSLVLVAINNCARARPLTAPWLPR
jgi:hypothetical protein